MMTTQTAFRLPSELVERVDAYAARMKQQLHIDITRTDAVTMLLQAALKAEHVPTPKQPTLPHVDPKPRKKTNVKR